MFDLVLGTNNAKKLVELRLLLPEDKIRLTTLAEIPDAIDVAETGATFHTLYTGSLSHTDGPAATYFDYMTYNIQTIVEALGGVF